jgi:hypothetical protein
MDPEVFLAVQDLLPGDPGRRIVLPEGSQPSTMHCEGTACCGRSPSPRTVGQLVGVERVAAHARSDSA